MQKELTPPHPLLASPQVPEKIKYDIWTLGEEYQMEWHSMHF